MGIRDQNIYVCDIDKIEHNTYIYERLKKYNHNTPEDRASPGRYTGIYLYTGEIGVRAK